MFYTDASVPMDVFPRVGNATSITKGIKNFARALSIDRPVS